MSSVAVSAMSNEDNRDREVDLRDRIASLMRANAQAPRKRITAQEQEKLHAAANRLDEILKAGEDEQRQALKSAAARLDQMLKNIRKGKDITIKLKQRRDG
jgi:GTP cyclohydrolase I